MFVLVDCNNFYASCERLFNPSFLGRAVIVLSNNDGCVVARSNEVKALGIKMGEPYFKIRDLCEIHQVVVFSSNYQLYGDISQRIMSLLKEFCPAIEVYSIDEAFLYFPSDKGLYQACVKMRRQLLQWVGIPVSMGIGKTKTLAKVASKLAKKEAATGVFNLCSEEVLKPILVTDLWGISKGFAARLYALSIRTAWQLKEASPLLIRKKMGVVGERIVRELNGISCLGLEEVPPKKSIMCSRSFGKVLTEIEPIQEALATHVASACTKMRQQSSCASALCISLIVQLEPGTHQRDHISLTIGLQAPSRDTGHLITVAKKGLQQLFRKGQRYKKVGVICLDLVHERSVINDLFFSGSDPKRDKVFQLVDALNDAYGKNTVYYAAMGVQNRWKMRCEKRSLRCTTQWDELKKVT